MRKVISLKVDGGYQITVQAKNPATGLDCLLMCLNGTAGQVCTVDFAIISKALRVVEYNTQID